MASTFILPFVPIFAFILITGTCIGSYVTAVTKSHVDGFPYISDVGDTAPESSWFSQGMNMSSVLISVISYLRYVHTAQLVKALKLPKIIGILNSIMIYFGYAISIGLSMTANYQTSSNHIPHYIGGTTFFISCTIYFPMQTACTYKLLAWLRWPGSVATARLRYVLTMTVVVCSIIMTYAHYAANAKYVGNDTRKWSSADGGYGFHVVAACCQWLNVFLYSLYLCSFCTELRTFEYRQLQVSDAGFEDMINGTKVTMSDA